MVFVPDLAAGETSAIVFMLFVTAGFISAMGLVPSARSVFMVGSVLVFGSVFFATATAIGFVSMFTAGYF